jgi:hypothetical protein
MVTLTIVMVAAVLIYMRKRNRRVRVYKFAASAADRLQAWLLRQAEAASKRAAKTRKSPTVANPMRVALRSAGAPFVGESVVPAVTSRDAVRSWVALYA